MRITFTLILLLHNIISCYSQVPQGIPYQAVARNSAGQPLASRAVNVRFSVLDSTAIGTAVYVESHQAATNTLGLFTVNVGMGTASTGTFSTINWGVNSKFLKIELDTTASGNSYMELGTQQMMSVPYALYAGSAGYSFDSIVNSSPTFTMISNTPSGAIRYWNALAYCANLQEGGYTDWHLPSLEEIENYVKLNGFPSSVLTTWTTTAEPATEGHKIVVSINDPNTNGEVFHFSTLNTSVNYYTKAQCVR